MFLCNPCAPPLPPGGRARRSGAAAGILRYLFEAAISIYIGLKKLVYASKSQYEDMNYIDLSHLLLLVSTIFIFQWDTLLEIELSIQNYKEPV